MIPTLAALRRSLHENAELSSREVNTKNILYEFLKQHTDLEIYQAGGGIVAAHREGNFPTLAFRADFDAIMGPDGKPYHGCGHDGHSAILAGLGMMIRGKQLGKNILLLFQSAEETGAGALPLVEAIQDREQVAAVFGFHNIPKYPLGQVLLHKGCFAPASRGLMISLKGQQSHAAYPELGKNPVPILGKLAAQLDMLVRGIKADGLLMATIVGINAGGQNFGISAGECELCLTLRAHHAADIDLLEDSIRTFLAEEADGFAVRFEHKDVFPDTQNDDGVMEKCTRIFEKSGILPAMLPESMRWSEDFGHFSKAFPSMYFGLGIGEEHAALHTEGYEFDDALLKPAINVLYTLASEY